MKNEKLRMLLLEYNPFHNGIFIIPTSKEKKRMQSVVIVVMSGNFLQSANPQIVDKKWTRCRDGLSQGADLVVELPVSFKCSTSRLFR